APGRRRDAADDEPGRGEGHVLGREVAFDDELPSCREPEHTVSWRPPMRRLDPIVDAVPVVVSYNRVGVQDEVRICRHREWRAVLRRDEEADVISRLSGSIRDDVEVVWNHPVLVAEVAPNPGVVRCKVV